MLPVSCKEQVGSLNYGLRVSGRCGRFLSQSKLLSETRSKYKHREARINLRFACMKNRFLYFLRCCLARSLNRLRWSSKSGFEQNSPSDHKLRLQKHCCKNPDCNWQSTPTTSTVFGTDTPDLVKLQCEQGAFTWLQDNLEKLNCQRCQ